MDAPARTAIGTAPGRLPLVGHLPAYLRNRLEFYARCADAPEAVVRYRLANTAYLVSDPEDIRHVLVRNHRNYRKARRLVGPRPAWSTSHELMTSTGADHQHKRRHIQKVYREPLTQRMAERARANAERLVAGWSDGAQIDVTPALTGLAQRNILDTLFESAPEEWLERLTATTAARRRFFQQVYFSTFPYPQYLPTRTNFDYLRTVGRIRPAIDREIAGRRGTSERPPDMVSMLMDIVADDGSAMGDRQLRDEMLTLALTGHDTVGAALAWILIELARHPEVEARVAAAPPEDAYAGRVVKEVLRLYPPSWIMARIALEDDVLPSGAPVAAGARVHISPWVVHRDPRLWRDPDRFDPDRFREEASAERPRYAYFPFGGGPHVCIGESLATAQILAVLATILARWRLTLVPGHEPVPEGGLSLRPRPGLPMRVERRAAG